MSADGSIELVWGDGLQRFRFAIGQFRELQEKVNLRRLSIGAPMVGPMVLLKALEKNDAWPDDVRDVLRIGLIGGGMKPADAHRAMVNYFDETPPLSHMRPAHTVLLIGLVGNPDDPVGSKKKMNQETPPPPSDFPTSTDQALQ